MLKPGNLLTAAQNRRGATAVIVAICLVMLIGFAALAVDVGYLYATRNELQNVADAGALAGAGHLGSVYATLSYSEQQIKEFTFEEVATAVNEVTEKNKAAGVSIHIRHEEADGDIVIGKGEWVDEDSDGKDEFKITQTLTTPNAVQVIARRDSNINNPVSTFFARIFKLLGADFDTVIVRAVATAALTGSTVVEEGELKVPFGLSENVFPNNCANEIAFSPTADSCAAWHNFLDPMQGHGTGINDKLSGLVQGDDSLCDECEGLNPGDVWLEANFALNQTPDEMVTPKIDLNNYDQENPLCFNFQGGEIADLLTGEALDPNTYDGNTAEGYIDSSEYPNRQSASLIALFDYFRYRDDDGDDSVWTATVPVYEDGETCENPSGCLRILGFAKIVIYSPYPPPNKTLAVHVDCNISYIQGRGGGIIAGNLNGTIPNLVE